MGCFLPPWDSQKPPQKNQSRFLGVVNIFTLAIKNDKKKLLKSGKGRE